MAVAQLHYNAIQALSLFPMQFNAVYSSPQTIKNAQSKSKASTTSLPAPESCSIRKAGTATEHTIELDDHLIAPTG